MIKATTIKATTGTGGKVTIRKLGDGVSGGASELNQAQFDAYQKARLEASPLNGGDLAKAKETLERAGFEVYLE